MIELPFQLLIKNAFAKNKEESLTCIALLRTIPDKRRVYDALWNDREVIVKVFSDKISASRHLKREWQGLTLLQKRSLNAPAPLFYGQTKDNALALVMEKIPNSSTAIEVFNQTTDSAEKFRILTLLCSELAKQHIQGALQKDLHLGNFLLAADKVFAIDPAQTSFLSHPLPKSKSISQLALLAGFLPQSDTESIDRLCEQYFSQRDWNLDQNCNSLFRKLLASHRKKGLRKCLKKCLRTSSKHQKIKNNEYLAIFKNSFCHDADTLDFMKNIDQLMAQGQILKDGNTCYVSRINYNGNDIVIKRYNNKGLIHSLRHTIKKSRARRSWLQAHRLLALDIPTLKPLAFIEKRKAMLLKTSYFITGFIKGQNFHYFIRDKNVTQQQHSKVIEKINETLNTMAIYKITHGDLKQSNIIIANDTPILTDLDATKVHTLNFTYTRDLKKDMNRLTKGINPSHFS